MPVIIDNYFSHSDIVSLHCLGLPEVMQVYQLMDEENALVCQFCGVVELVITDFLLLLLFFRYEFNYFYAIVMNIEKNG